MARHLRLKHKGLSQQLEILRTQHVKYPIIMSKPTRKRSNLWKFFEEIDSNTTRCKACLKLMSRNMARHLRKKHPTLYRQLQSLQTREKDVLIGGRTGFPRSWVKKYCKKLREGKYQCGVCDKVLSMAHGLFGNMKRHIKNIHPYIYHKEIKRLSDTTDEDDEESQSSVIRTENVLIDEDATDVEDFLDECTGDKRVLDKLESIAEGDFNDDDCNTAVSHEEVVETQTEDILSFDTANVKLSEEAQNFEEKVKFLCSKTVRGKKNVKSYIWNFYDVVEENHIYECLACKKQVAMYPNSISNLKRHIKLKHKKQHELMMKYLSPGEKYMPATFDKYYFETEIEGQYKCKECNDIITCDEDDRKLLFDHIRDKHLGGITGSNEEQSDEEEYLMIVKKKDIQLD